LIRNGNPRVVSRFPDSAIRPPSGAVDPDRGLLRRPEAEYPPGRTKRPRLGDQFEDSVDRPVDIEDKNVKNSFESCAGRPKSAWGPRTKSPEKSSGRPLAQGLPEGGWRTDRLVGRCDVRERNPRPKHAQQFADQVGENDFEARDSEERQMSIGSRSFAIASSRG
jgi:hypothetical protein